ncbi:MAG: hypothetical protein ACI85H_001804, partial [Paracoccaceae bacterium]
MAKLIAKNVLRQGHDHRCSGLSGANPWVGHFSAQLGNLLVKHV